MTPDARTLPIRPRSVVALLLSQAVIGLVLVAGAARAQDADGDGKPSLQQLQQMRFPQPVRVGSLPGEPVIEAGEHLKRLGVVKGVFRTKDGDLQLVFHYGAWLGLGGRDIAPALEEVSLVGPMVKINELDRKDLQALPTFTGSGGALLGPNETIRMGVDRKY